MIDVAVVGAGLAGLVCAQQLQRAGLSVVVIEKSRGLGGRLATRRLQGSCADHGARYLEIQGALTELLIQTLLAQNLVQPWSETLYTASKETASEAGTQFSFTSLAKSSYTAPTGLTAVAKWLAAGLEIWLAERVDSLNLERNHQETGWQLTLTPGNRQPLLARSVVLAIPAPQALALVEPLASPSDQTLTSVQTLDQTGDRSTLAAMIEAIRSVAFDPCITAIAAYPEASDLGLTDGASDLAMPWQGILAASPDLAWISQEQTKGRAHLPVLVVQSTATFASQHLEAPDLRPVGQLLLQQTAKLLAGSNLMAVPATSTTGLETPHDLQVHRWRYGLVQRSLPDLCLTTSLPAPLICGGDWCGGHQIENALASGLAAAEQTAHLFKPDRYSKSGTLLTGEPTAQWATLLHQLTGGNSI